MAAAGAAVEVYATDPCEEMNAVATNPPAGSVTIHRKHWDAGRGRMCACHWCVRGRREARAIPGFSSIRGRTLQCDRQAGFLRLLVRRHRQPLALVVAISTDGAAPVFAQAIRSRIEAMLPAGFARWAEAARNWRGAVKQSGLPFNGRRLFWQIFTRAALQNPNGRALPGRFRRADGANESRSTRCRIRFCHTGRRGTRRSGIADAARSARPAIRRRDTLRRSRFERGAGLRAPRGEADAGRQDRTRPIMQAVRDQRADGRPRQGGRRVVRLKGGDPMIFGRAGEEIEACREAGIAIEIVPGITAAQGAASRLGSRSRIAAPRAACNTSPATARTARCQRI